MEPKKLNDDITVNDGGGLYDSIGLIDSLIVDCNELPRALFSGKFVQFCSMIVGMVQKLANLKQGIKNDMESLKEQIEEKQALLDELSGKKSYGGEHDV